MWFIIIKYGLYKIRQPLIYILYKKISPIKANKSERHFDCHIIILWSFYNFFLCIFSKKLNDFWDSQYVYQQRKNIFTQVN